jgi:nucleoside-diphosphate-sugar epimerase
MIEAIRKAAGNASPREKALPWFILKLASPFNETLREHYATRPIWETPIDLDNARIVQFLGQEPHTPLDKAVDATLRAFGCLGA